MVRQRKLYKRELDLLARAAASADSKVEAENQEDNGWGIALLQKVESIESQLAELPRLLALYDTVRELAEQVATLTPGTASGADLGNLGAILGDKVDSLRSALLAVTAKLDAEDVTNLDSNYTETVETIL